MKVINLFGGPGSGKSTTAAAAFAMMKNMGLRVELVTEYAKDLTYEKGDLTNQLSILGEQDRRLRRLLGQVDYVVTDSPLLLGLMYASGSFSAPWFTSAALGAFGSYDNVNFLLRRVKPYATYGRGQTEDEAKVIDERTRCLLVGIGYPFETVDGDEFAASTIIHAVTQGGQVGQQSSLPT